MSSNLNRNIQFILVFSLVVILVSSSFSLINGQAVNNKPIRLGINLWVPDLLTYVAQEKGFFKKNNVDVNLTLLSSYEDLVNSYSNNDFEGIFSVYSDSIIQQSEGIDTKVVYNLDTSLKAHVIVGNGNNLTELKGKKIGVGGINSFSHMFVLKALQSVGLSEGDVQFVNVPPQNISEELQKGDIFAGHTFEPYTHDAIKKGYKILSTGADIPGTITSILAFHSDIVQQRPVDIQNIVKSMIEARADYDKNKEQDISIMSSKSGLSKE